MNCAPAMRDAHAHAHTMVLAYEKPLGQAIVESRLAARAARANDLGWASYIYYGDPRLWFRRRP
jgi:hypothetical protein